MRALYRHIQKLVWIQHSCLYAAATPLALGRGKEGNTHRQVPYGGKLEEGEKEESCSSSVFACALLIQALVAL